MRIKAIALLLACLPQAAWVETYYQADAAGNVNQINIGVGKSKRLSRIGNEEHGESLPGRREFDLQAFTRLRVRVPAEVVIVRSGGNSVKLEGPDAGLEAIRVSQQGTDLVIESSENFAVNHQIEIHIAASSLGHVKLSGAIDARLEQIAASQFTLELEGAVDLEASGRVDQCRLTVHGSGDADLRDLRCAEVDLSLSGSGDLQVYADKRIAGTLRGLGDISVSGNPRSRELVASGLVTLEYD